MPDYVTIFIFTSPRKCDALGQTSSFPHTEMTAIAVHSLRLLQNDLTKKSYSPEINTRRTVVFRARDRKEQAFMYLLVAALEEQTENIRHRLASDKRVNRGLP